MANKRKYTDEERAENLKASKRKYYENNKAKYTPPLSIAMRSDEERQKNLDIITAHGFDTPADFWRHCIRLLEAGQLPPKQPTDTDTGKPSNQ